MQTKMSIFIAVKNCTDSKELHEDLKPYKLNIIDISNRALVRATIDIREPDVEDIIRICKKYGDCEVEAHLVNKKDSD